ncbi:MAG: PAS domain S-box protein [Candidatus Thorarchaeota archaeon]|nr:PAS domain S-box protein [Candidatus Thorarchaeota archaeon]
MPQDERTTKVDFKLDERHYRELLTYLPEGVGITDMEENLIFVNDEFAAMLGYEREELLGMNLYNLIPEREKDLIDGESVKRAVGVASAYNLTMVRKDGGEIIVRVSGVPRRDEDDNVIGTMAVVIDVTTERERELELLKLSGAITASPTSVVITDLEGTIEYVNPKFSELTGYTSEDAVGENPRILKSGLTTSETYNELWTTLKSGNIWYGRFINRKKNGSLYWEDAWIAPILNQDGDATHYVAVKEDITRAVISEEKLQHSHQDLELYASFLQHDLRNDLQVLMSYAETALMKVEKGTSVGEYLEVIQAASERMVNLLDVFGRPAESDESNIVRILEKSKIHAEKTHPNLTVKIVVNTEDTEVPSTRLIPMVFDNLLRNSAKYAEKDVTVTFEITSKDDYVYITMSDDGPGVSKEIQSNLFEKGVSTTGGGYGLYLTKKVVEGYGGTIEYIQDEGRKGATFRIVLPSKPS